MAETTEMNFSEHDTDRWREQRAKLVAKFLRELADQVESTTPLAFTGSYYSEHYQGNVLGFDPQLKSKSVSIALEWKFARGARP